MSFFTKLTILLGIFSLTTLAQFNSDSVSIGGSYLGVFNNLSQNQTQFDFATNINIDFEVIPNLTGSIEFQSSPGNGSLGFTGPSTVVTDLTLFYILNINNHTTKLTFGSFDTAFGFETQFLSNNANTFNNLYILNSLTYASLAGQMGTLNTLGIQVENNFDYFDITTSISNGTAETAYNENKSFEHLIQVSTDSLINDLRLTGTYFKSDDNLDTSDSFQTDLTAILYEINYVLLKTIELKMKNAYLHFNDQNPGTSRNDDEVITYEVEINYNKEPFFIGLRGSFWRGLNNSTEQPNPGLAQHATSGTIDRFQLGFGSFLDQKVLVKSEIIYEKYLNEFENYGFISGINVLF